MQRLIDHFFDWLLVNVDRPARILLILGMAWIAMRAIDRLITKLQAAFANHQTSREDGQRILTLSRVIRYILTVTTAVLAGLLVLGELGISVVPILGAAGVVGIAAGFGAQSLVKDYFTGFFLLLEKQVRIGDVVEAGGKAGLVEELTLRYLRLRDYSGNVHYIPNGTITAVTNMSQDYAYAVVDVSVACGEDVDRVMSVMRDVGEAMRHDGVLAAKMRGAIEIAGVDSWADSTITIRCRLCSAPMEQWNVRREYLRRLKLAFDKEAIEMPYQRVRVIHTPSSKLMEG